MPRNAREVLDQEFLAIRAKILEVAAFFDRLDAAEPGEMSPEHLKLLQTGCDILTDDDGDKAARVQLLFSRQYEENWREKFSL